MIGELDISGEEDGQIDLNLSTGKKEVYVIDVRIARSPYQEYVVFIQSGSGSGHDHNQVTSANCTKAGSKINHPL